jgi:hypothetical protein
MPLIERSFYKEGRDGQTVVQSYYVNEKRKSPYAHPDGTKVERAAKRAAKYLKESKRVTRSAHEKGYTHSMGYNQCSARYSTSRYSRFSGSSLNRNPQLKLYEGEQDLPAEPGDYFKMAVKAAKEYSRRRLPIPAEISDYIVARDKESEGKFRLWLSLPRSWPENGISFGIHVLSTRSRGKIKDKATAFFRSCPGDRTFATLSFIAPVDDYTGVTILNKFLVAMRKKFPTLQYLWVAERQTGDRNEGRGVVKEATGNIHFHLILNKYLPAGQWNALWVLQQYNSGLIGHDKWGRELTKEYITELYILDQKEKFKGAVGRTGKKISRIQAELNPLDVKKVKDISGLSGYLTKYITKQKKNEPFGCAVWHCSRRVSRLFVRATVGPSAFAYMRSFNNYKVDFSTGECFPPVMSPPHPFYSVVYAANKDAPLRYLKEMEKWNKEIMAGHVLDLLPIIDDDAYRKVFCKN